MKEAVLLLQCHDKPGIVAGLTTALYGQGANIIEAQQFSTAEEDGHFFFRIRFSYHSSSTHLKDVRDTIQAVLETFRARWELYSSEKRLRMGILVSKPGHCLADILYRWQSNELEVEIPFVLSNHKDHEAMVHHYGIPYHYIPASSNDKKEGEILKTIGERADFLILARYMQILSADFLKRYQRPIINIHHSFLPSFKGANPFKRAFDRGVKVIGATAHFVTEGLDEGPIISQQVSPVSHRDTVQDIKRKSRNLETLVLSDAVSSFTQHRVMEFENKTIILD